MTTRPIDELSLLLHGSRAQALLVGTARHVPGAKVEGVPAVADSVADLATHLVEHAGLAVKNLTCLIDPEDPVRLSDAIHEVSQKDCDVLLFFYAGHGLLGPDNKLYLATLRTVDIHVGPARNQALPFAEVRDLLSRGGAGLTVVILDCCFGGRAEGWPGSYLLTSTSGKEAAWAIPGERHTAFTGELIRLLAEGDPTAPSLLTVEDLYVCLARAMRARGLPAPRRQLADSGIRLPLVANASFQHPKGHPLPTVATGGGSHSPYPGLRAFGVDDSLYFFGRKDLTQTLVRRVTEQTGVPLVVTGPSGSGKSSVLRAGLIPKLRSRHHILLAPGADPVGRLVREIAAVAEIDEERLRAEADQDPASLGRALTAETLIVVDQFEEVFAVCDDEERRRSFIGMLTALCADPRAAVVIGLRADFFGHCMSHPALVEALRYPEVISAMSLDQLREVIVKPALTAGLTLDDGLVELLLEDLGVRSEAALSGIVLPLLSHALLATWQLRENGVLTLAAYRATGGIARSLAKTADEVLASLSAADRVVARRTLIRLVRLGKDTADTRMRVPIGGLVGPDEHDVFDTLVRARLVTVDEDTAEIVHEALIRGWPQLRRWIEGDRGDLTARQQLIEDATKWRQQGYEYGYLYSSRQLAAIAPARERWESFPDRYHALDETPRAFLDASELATEHAARLRRRITIALVALTVASLVGAGIAVVTAERAISERNSAISRQLSAQSVAVARTDPQTAQSLATAGWHFAKTAEARHSLLNVLANPGRSVIAGRYGAVNSVTFSPDGRVLAIAGDDGAVRLWDVATHRQIGEALTGHGTSVWSVAFSGDGKMLATASDDSTVRLWDATTRQRIGEPLTGHKGAVYDVAFDSGGRMLATAGDDETVRFWDVATHRQIGEPLTSGADSFTSVAFAADDRVLATGSRAGAVRLWDVGTRRQIGTRLTGHQGAVSDLVFRPDGNTLATASRDGTARLWDVAGHHQIGEPVAGRVVGLSRDGRTLAATTADDDVRLLDVATRQQRGEPLPNPPEGVRTMDFSPDARMLATAGSDGAVRLWDVNVHHVRGAPVTGLKEAMYGVAFSPDGRTLATSGADGTAHVWDTVTQREITPPLSGHRAAIWATAFSPDGRTLATAGDDGTVRLWNLATHRQHDGPPMGHGGSVTSVAFSPDGRTLVTSGADRTVRLWNVDTHQQSGSPIIDPADDFFEVVFSPDGTMLATAGERNARLWRISTRKVISTLTDGVGPVSALAFSPDGTMLATVSGDKTARIWSMSTFDQMGEPLAGHSGAVTSVAFSPDSRVLATSSNDTTARLWDVASHRQIGQALTGHIKPVWRVAIGPGGRLAATVSEDRSFRLWDIAQPGDPFAAVCGIARRSLSPQEWQQFLPDETFQQVCPGRS